MNVAKYIIATRSPMSIIRLTCMTFLSERMLNYTSIKCEHVFPYRYEFEYNNAQELMISFLSSVDWVEIDDSKVVSSKVANNMISITPNEFIKSMIDMYSSMGIDELIALASR